MEKPIDIVEQGIYIEPNVFDNDSEYELFHSYLESRKYVEWLESELKKLRVADVSGRSEQLVSFLQWYVKDEAKRDEPNRIVNIVERYLNETNCH